MFMCVRECWCNVKKCSKLEPCTLMEEEEEEEEEEECICNLAHNQETWHISNLYDIKFHPSAVYFGRGRMHSSFLRIVDGQYAIQIWFKCSWTFILSSIKWTFTLNLKLVELKKKEISLRWRYQFKIGLNRQYGPFAHFRYCTHTYDP